MIYYKNIVDVAPLNMNSSTVRDKYEKKQINYNTWSRQHGSPQEIHPKIFFFFFHLVKCPKRFAKKENHQESNKWDLLLLLYWF